MLEIIYVSRRRSKEKPILDHLKTKKLIKYRQFEFSSQNALESIRSFFSLINNSNHHNETIILSEGLGIISLFCLIIAKLNKYKMAVRIKGDPFIEFSDTIKSARLSTKFIKVLQFQSSKIVLKKADRLIPISAHIKELLLSKNLNNIGGIIPIPHMPPEKKDINMAPQKFVITVTNFNFWSKVQHIPNYVDSLASILRENNYLWYILGDGICRKSIENNEAIKSHLDIVKFLGHIEPGPYFANASALFYISSLDSFSNVVLESFSYDLPVLVNDEFPVLEIKEKSHAVCIVRRSDSDHLLHKKVNRILSDEKYRKTLTRNGNQFLENLTAQKISQDLFHEFSLLVENKS